MNEGKRALTKGRRSTSPAFMDRAAAPVTCTYEAATGDGRLDQGLTKQVGALRCLLLGV